MTVRKGKPSTIKMAQGAEKGQSLFDVGIIKCTELVPLFVDDFCVGLKCQAYFAVYGRVTKTYLTGIWVNYSWVLGRLIQQ